MEPPLKLTEPPFADAVTVPLQLFVTEGVAVLINPLG